MRIRPASLSPTAQSGVVWLPLIVCGPANRFFLKFQPMTGSYVARAWLLHEYPDL